MNAVPGLRLVALRCASVRFGDVAALTEVDLSVHAGERIALVGANGSGKTTLLRLLVGLQPASSGDCVRHRSGPNASTSAMLFQRPFLLHLSARRNLLLALWLRGVPWADRGRRADDALRRVGLFAERQRPARTLSGGQQQRLALARAWSLEPDILYLDEPTASLDPSAKREVEALIDAFARDGVTIVMSTHNLGQVKRLCRRVLYLESGRLVIDLPVERFFNDPLPTEAAQFLKGELPWNVPAASPAACS